MTTQANRSSPRIDVELPAKFLQKILVPAEALDEECVFQFEEDGLNVPVDDPANVAFANVFLASAAFAKYDIEEISIGIEVEELQNALKHVDDEDTLKIQYDLEDKRLNIDAESQHFSLRTLDPDDVTDEPSIPDIEYSARVVIPGSEFNRAVLAANEFSDYLVIYIQEDEGVLKMQGKGDINTAERTIGEDKIEEINVGPSYNVYSLDYLSKLVPAINSDVSVHMYLGEKDRPMKMEFTFADGFGEVLFYIAPRIQTNSETDESGD